MRWTQKLWSSLKALPGDLLGLVVQGSLPEVNSHLWHHQALYFQLGDEHLCVHFSEILDPSADLNVPKVVREVQLDEELNDHQGGGGTTVKITLTLIDLTIATEEVDVDLSQLTRPSEVFQLTLRLPEGSRPLAQELSASRTTTPGLHLRFDSVEHFLDLSMRSELPKVQYQFPLVDNWEDLQEALSTLQVYLQIDDACEVEIPVEMSNLLAALNVDTVSTEVSAEVFCGPTHDLEAGLPFLATLTRMDVRSPPLNGKRGELDIWEKGSRLLAVGPRHWRLSIEIRSVRLTERGANVFVSYNYPPLGQPRPFRTTPPNLVRKKATVAMPHSFAAYSLQSTFDELQARLQEALYLEVWHRDLYRKDSVLGISEADLSSLSSQPLERNLSKVSMPMAVEGFQVLDQACPIIDGENESQVGSLRVVVFLEDLGLVPGTKVETSASRKGRAEKAVLGPVVAAIKSQVKSQAATEAPLKGAYELEMWRQAEEEKFRLYLVEQEQELQERLEEEFQQKEELRASDFAQRKAKLQDLELTTRKKLQELQERELAVVAEETRVSTLQEEVQRRMGLAVSQHEDATKRDALEAEHSLELARQRSHFLEEQCQSLEVQLQVHLTKLTALQEKHLTERPTEVEAPTEMREELQALRLQLREQQLRNEAIATSRDHFKRKVEELCGRLMGGSRYWLQAPDAKNMGPASPTFQGPDLAMALRQVQEDLAKLADTWTETPKRTSKDGKAETPQSTEKWSHPSRVGKGQAMEAMQDPKRLEQHLAWLHDQQRELLESGLYGGGDPVLQALQMKIAQAEAQLKARG